MLLEREGLDYVKDLDQSLKAALFDELIESDAAQLFICDQLLQL